MIIFGRRVRDKYIGWLLMSPFFGSIIYLCCESSEFAFFVAVFVIVIMFFLGIIVMVD